MTFELFSLFADVVRERDGSQMKPGFLLLIMTIRCMYSRFDSPFAFREHRNIGIRFLVCVSWILVYDFCELIHVSFNCSFHIESRTTRMSLLKCAVHLT
jgi:hypothetical protein